MISATAHLIGGFAKQVLRHYFVALCVWCCPTLGMHGDDWLRIGPDWRDEKPQSKAIVVPFRDWTAIFDVNLNQRLNQLRMCSAELSQSRRSIEIKLYNAIVSRTTNDFPEEFSSSLEFKAWSSPGKRDGELLGSIEGQVHLNPKDSQFPIASTKIIRSIAGEGKVVFIYEWKMTIPLREPIDDLPPLLEAWGGCNCAPYEAGIREAAHGTLLIYTLRPNTSPAEKTARTEPSSSALAITSDIRLPTNELGKVQLSISKADAFLRIDCPSIPGVKALERTALSESGWNWQLLDRNTNEVSIRWYVQPQQDNGVFRVRVE